MCTLSEDVLRVKSREKSPVTEELFFRSLDFCSSTPMKLF